MSKWGEVQKQNVFVMDEIREDIVLPLEDNPFARCCYELCVFADPADTDKYKNDWSSILKIIPQQYSSVNMELQKKEDGVWTTKATLVDDTYGTYYPLGFVEKNNKDYVGYKINWREVFNAPTWGGRGKYRILFDLVSRTITSEEYCLEQFSTRSVDGTIRIEYLWNSVIGSKYSDERRDFSQMEWNNQIRFKEAIFGYKNASMEEESVRMQDGKQRTIKKEWLEEYKMIIRRLPLDLHDILLYDIAQADEVVITDYNSWNSSGNYAEKEVEFSGGYDPNYSGTTAQPSVLLTFKDRYTNRRKLYS